MELVVISVAVIAVRILAAGFPPPRYQRLRGAPRWTDADDAQRQHFDHWGRSPDPESMEDDE